MKILIKDALTFLDTELPEPRSIKIQTKTGNFTLKERDGVLTIQTDERINVQPVASNSIEIREDA